MTSASHIRATEQINSRLLSLLADTPARPTPHHAAKPEDQGLARSAHHDGVVELVEIGHFVLSSLVSPALAGDRTHAAANDDGRGTGHVPALLEEGPPTLRNPGRSNPLDRLPEPLRHSVVQLLISTAKVAFPVLRGKPPKGGQKEGLLARLRKARRAVRLNAKEIALESGIAGSGHVVFGLVRRVLGEIDVIYQRIMRAIEHSVLPFLQALRALFFPDPNITHRESMDAAIRLFVQAGIVGGCVFAEQALDELLQPLFPLTYIGLIVTCFMAFVCIIALRWAMHQIDELDPVGIRHHREMCAKVEDLCRRGAEFDTRIDALLSVAK